MRKQALAPLLAVVAALCLAPAVRADIVDFDPTQDTVPQILEPDELALVQQAMSADIVYMLSDVSPGGRYVMAYGGSGYGFLDLHTGSLMPLGSSPGSPLFAPRWLDEDTMGEVTVETVSSGQGEPDVTDYYWVELGARDGSVDARPFDAAPLGGTIVDGSPGLSTFLVMELPPEAPPARVVEVGPSFGTGADDRLPEGLPGRVGARPQGTLALQQAAFTLALVDADGSNRRELSALPAETGIRSINWSPDGSQLALVTSTMPDWQSARPRGDDPPLPGTPNLGSINVQEALGLVPPTQNPLVTGTRLAVYATESGASVAMLQNADFLQGNLSGMVFSPSANQALLVIARRSDLVGRPYATYAYPAGTEIWLLDQALQPVRQVTGPGLDQIAGLQFVDDERVAFVLADEVDSHIVTYRLSDGAISPVWQEPGGIMQMLAGGDQLVFSRGDIGQPWELWSGAVPAASDSADSGQASLQAHQVTDFSPAAAVLGQDLRAEPVSWRSGSGDTIYGVYVHDVAMPYPPADPGPLVVWQAGGPGGQMTRGYGSSVEEPYSILPHFGLPVLIANAAGRNVKSDAFYSSMADDRNFGQLDIAQIRDGIDALARRGIVHPGRVGVTGCSYGGYFTLQSLREFPDVYAAGNPQCSLVDLTEEFTFGFTPFIAYLMGRTPMADAAEYLRDSPYYGAGHIHAKVLLFHGLEDFLPVQLLNNIHDELDADGVPVTFFRVAGEGHGFGQPESELYGAELQIRFFRQNLVDADVGPAPTYGRTIYLPATFDRSEP